MSLALHARCKKKNLNICCWHLLLLPFTTLASKASNVMCKIRPVRFSLVACITRFHCFVFLLSNVGRFHLAAHFFRRKNAVVICRVIGIVVFVRRETLAAAIVAACATAVVELRRWHIQAKRSISRCDISMFHHPSLDSAFRVTANIWQHVIVL